MPRFNGMGPEGKGTQTGRCLGKCNADNSNVNKHTKDELMNSGNGRGRQNRRRGKN